MNKYELFKKLYTLKQKREEYYSRIPTDINNIFYNNVYIDCMEMESDLLLSAIFEDKVDKVMWFLYDWKKGCSVSITQDGTTYEAKIYSVDTYTNWLKLFEPLED